MPPVTIEKIPLFKGLAAKELEAVKACLKEKAFGKGEALFFEGASCEKVFFVKEGRVKLCRTSASGREQVLEVLGPGDTCACNPGADKWACLSSAEAIEPSTVWFLSREHYVRLVATNTEISHALNRLFADRLRCLSVLVEEVSLKDAKKRLVKFLIDMLEDKQKKFPRTDSLFIPFTREEIAQRIGTARETVARHLYQLKRQRLIDIQPHQITILKEDALRKLL